MSAVPYTNETPLPLGTALYVRRMNAGGTAEEFAAPAGAPSGTGLAEIVAGSYVTAQRRGILPAVRLAWVGPDAATVTGVAPALTLTADANGALGVIDGETPAVGDRVLTLYGASAKSLVWVIATLGDAGTPWTMTLAPDARSVEQLARGTLAQVSDGATYGDGRVWRLATTGTITPGTTVLTWERKVAVTADITAAVAAVTPASIGAVAIGTAGHPGATGALTSARPTLTSGTTTVTLTGASTAGQVFYATSTVGTYGLALGTAVGTSRVAGVYDGVAATLVTGGVVGMLFDAGLTSLTTGDQVFLSAATAGRVTKTAPAASTNVVAEVGILLDGGSYDNGAGSVHAVLWQPKSTSIVP